MLENNYEQIHGMLFKKYKHYSFVVLCSHIESNKSELTFDYS